jgi:endonuclease YncB( thermonuclease family)
MFRWRRKNDGFVWREYVRTTILVRRDQRRQKVEEIRDAAVDGIKHAGRETAALSVAGAQATARGIARALAATYYAVSDAISVGAAATALWIADRFADASPALRSGIHAIVEGCRKPVVSTTLFVLAGAAALATAALWGRSGFEPSTIWAAAVSAIALLSAMAPRIADLELGARLDFGQIGSGTRARKLPWPNWIKLSPGVVVRSAVVGVGLVAAMTWLVPALTSNSPTSSLPHSQVAMVAATGRVEGKAVAVSGDELRVGGEAIRLAGIETPERSQNCVGVAGKGQSCGTVAKTALQKLVAGKRITCEISGRLADGTSTAACQVNGADIAGQLVRGGHVFAISGLFATYASAEREARTAKAGLWRAGDPVRPADFRAKVWAEAKGGAPDGCPIKGIVSGDSKSYLVPWASAYEKAKIRPTRGERWFCSEEDARAAGWKPASPS